jgi:class 3 adenylate cyclase
MDKVRYRYASLEDYLASVELTVDAQLDDGWGAKFPLRGRELEASVLFSDISGFSARTRDLNPTATLAFVNRFFTWIAAEALRHYPGIVDKYIGDEVMVIFAQEFGSAEPFSDALRTAVWMGENDAWGFGPHVGIASGAVTIGYVGTPLRYNCSVFGAPVALAARCAAVRPQSGDRTSIVFPAAEWGDRELGKIAPSGKWELRAPRKVTMKNLSDTEVREVVKQTIYVPGQSAEDAAREQVVVLAQTNRYWPKGRQGAE